jgi:hypothetical protein
MISPSREGGHAYLGKNSLGVIKSLTPSRSVPNKDSAYENENKFDTGTCITPDNDAKVDEDAPTESPEPVLKDSMGYACRFWASHCAELITIVENPDQSQSGYYGGHGSFKRFNDGVRWKSLREDIMDFFKNHLLWWSDTIRDHGWASYGVQGLRRLRSVLEVGYLPLPYPLLCLPLSYQLSLFIGIDLEPG